jgi:hypothetical protein
MSMVSPSTTFRTVAMTGSAATVGGGTRMAVATAAVALTARMRINDRGSMKSRDQDLRCTGELKRMVDAAVT